MKLILLCLIALTLTACNTITSRLPSVENCQHVNYQRDYSVVKIQAECDTSLSGTIAP